MRNTNVIDRLNRLEGEIRKKEFLAQSAKKKGMHTTYGNYMADLVLLKVQLQKIRTDPLRVLG